MISRSCASAISTGIVNLRSKRSATYSEITASAAMIAMIASWATVLPNVGPIEVALHSVAPYLAVRSLRRRAETAGPDFLNEIL